MFPILLTLVIVDTAVFVWTSLLGVLLESGESIRVHFTWGVVTSILLCFTHLLVLFYLIGTELDIKQALEERPDLYRKYVPWAKALKRRVFPLASLAALLAVVAAVLGAEVHSRLLVEARRLGVAAPLEDPPLRQVAGWWAHGAVVVLAFAVHVAASVAELRAVRKNRRGIDEINEILARDEAEALSKAGE